MPNEDDDSDHDDDLYEEDMTKDEVITELKNQLEQREDLHERDVALRVMHGRNIKQRVDNENLANVVSSRGMNSAGGTSRAELMKRKYCWW